MTERFCLFCGKKINNRNINFCNRDCQLLFKRRKEKEIFGLRKRRKVLGLEKVNRNWEIKIRLTAQERLKIENKSKELGLKISPYMRMVSLHSLKIPDMVIL